MDKINDASIEKMRMKLQEQHITEFLAGLDSPTDELAERNGLICVMSKALARLHEVEKGFITKQLEEMAETGGLCPSCLIDNVRDVTKVENLINTFNSYLEESNECDD